MRSIIAYSDCKSIVNSESKKAHNKPMKYPDFSARIRELWKESSAPKVQKELAKWLGFSQPTICDWLNGEKLPSMETAIKLSVKFGCNVNWLMTGIGDKYPNLTHKEAEVDISDLSIDNRKMILTMIDALKKAQILSRLERGCKDLEYLKDQLLPPLEGKDDETILTNISRRHENIATFKRIVKKYQNNK